jgi:hypothetical protein
MALNEYEERPKRSYVKLADGSCIQRVEKGTTGKHVHTRITDNGKGVEVTERFFASVTGRIIGAKIRPSEIPGKPKEEKGSIALVMIDDRDGSEFQLECGYFSPYGAGLLNQLCRLAALGKTGEVVTISPWKMASEKKKDDGSDFYNYGVSVYLGIGANKENRVPYHFSREEVPAWEKYRLNGKDQFNKEPQMSFLEDNWNRLFVSQLAGEPGREGRSPGNHEPAIADPASGAARDPGLDDIPF